MKIGIDARLYGHSGIGKYIAKLIENLEKIDTENEYVIFLKYENEKEYEPNNPNFKKWVVNAREYSFDEQVGFYFELSRAKLDLMHFTGPNQPLLYRGKQITTIHDFIMLDYNEEATTLPKYQYQIKQYVLKQIFNSSIKRSDFIILPTDSVKKELYDREEHADQVLLKLNKSANVIYEGYDNSLKSHLFDSKEEREQFLNKFKIYNNYILYVGNILPHKNLKDLIIAYKDLYEKKLYNGQLVIAGRVSEHSKNLAGFTRALKLERQIIFPVIYNEVGYLTDTDIANLYHGADCYVMPSKREGFSLTPLEAQSMGIPCLLSDIAVHKEIYGDSAIYFETDRVIDLTNKLYKLTIDTELRNKLVENGYENIKKYAFSTMAEETHKLYIQSLQTIK